MLMSRRRIRISTIALALLVIGGHSSTGREDVPSRGSTDRAFPEFSWDLDGKPAVFYFDFDDVRLNAQAKRDIRQLLSSIKGLTFASIEVVGHADRSGPEAYNADLSARRADAVASAFEICGVRSESTTVTHQGETSPAVETRDGVVEARNRRVEVILSQGDAATARSNDRTQAQPSGEQTFVVNFAFDQANFVGEAKQQLATMSAYAAKLDGGQVVITGHADRSGTEAYNEGLSLRRANEVAAAVLACGFNFDNVDITHKGESQPVIDTSDGIAEPRNRRVEITIKPG